MLESCQVVVCWLICHLTTFPGGGGQENLKGNLSKNFYFLYFHSKNQELESLTNRPPQKKTQGVTVLDFFLQG